MKRKLILIGLLIFNIHFGIGQSFQDVTAAESEDDINNICGNISLGFSSTPKTISKVIDEIVKTAGVAEGGFQLAQCSNINNAIAKIITDNNGNEVRYIIYDAEWLQSFNQETSKDWSGKFVLAHEIGHHLNGHSLNNGSSNHKFELESDYFAGRALANLGATLDETLAVTEKMSMKATYSHPGRAERGNQARAGWKSIRNKTLTISVKQEDVSEIAREIVAMIQEKLSNNKSLTQADFQKTIKQLQLVRGPKYYKGYTENIRYLEAVTLSGMNEPEKAMDSYINYLSIEGLQEESRIEQISRLFAESAYKNTAFFANPLVVYNLCKIYYNIQEYDYAISTGNQFLTRSEDEVKQSEIVKIIARSEFEKIENEMKELSPSESISEAKVHIDSEDYNRAIELLEPLANRNNSEAQFLLGTLYYNGSGVPTDYLKAANLIAKAAQFNNIDAQFKLGLIYLEGIGYTKSLMNSRFWLEQAVENNHPSAAAAFNTLLKEEEEAAIIEDEKKKEEKLKKLEDKMADQKVSSDISPKMTNRERRKAEKKKQEEAERIRKKREIDKKIEDGLLKATMKEPPFKTEEYSTEEVKMNSIEIIAKTMAKARSSFKNGSLSIAFENYLIAAKKGNAIAQERVGWMYTQGSGVNENIESGVDWLKKSAKKGNGDAIQLLTSLDKW